MGSAPSPWRNADLLFEGAIESRLGLVADLGCHLRHANPFTLEQSRRQLYAPARQILHGRILYEVREAMGEHGA